MDCLNVNGGYTAKGICAHEYINIRKRICWILSYLGRLAEGRPSKFREVLSMNKEELSKRLVFEGVPLNAYGLDGGWKDDTWWLQRTPTGWEVCCVKYELRPHWWSCLLYFILPSLKRRPSNIIRQCTKTSWSNVLVRRCRRQLTITTGKIGELLIGRWIFWRSSASVKIDDKELRESRVIRKITHNLVNNQFYPLTLFNQTLKQTSSWPNMVRIEQAMRVPPVCSCSMPDALLMTHLGR